ncbi:phosphatidylinositol N-acetylglucosaminyltransferase subunit C-like [Lineus longissimus]|uniref:phosphatidylinositol N-acetylglucosaminyltransferase subunit C-like n=1 Tax=Lineus longissimus TaxID=88925 RepID=UPI002B4F7623
MADDTRENFFSKKSTKSPKMKWRKVLYEDQHVPDNYVSDTFLDEMRKNLNTRNYQYWPVVRESGVVTQQISSVCIFAVVFIYMKIAWLTPQMLFVFSSVLTSIGYVLNDLIDGGEARRQSERRRRDDFSTVVMFISFGFGLSPILMTLTETISTDTIYAMTTIMLLANVLFHDYGTNAAVVSGALSFNAAIFASVCLASRLPSTWHGFASVTFAVEVFALWPQFRRKVKAHNPRCHVPMTIVTGLVAAGCIYSVSTVMAVIFVIIHIFITFICPMLLIHLQPYKNTIHGPWDEAMIQD